MEGLAWEQRERKRNRRGQRWTTEPFVKSSSDLVVGGVSKRHGLRTRGLFPTFTGLRIGRRRNNSAGGAPRALSCQPPGVEE